MKTPPSPISLPTEGYSFLWYFLKRHGKYYGPIVTCMLLWSVNEAVYPYFIKLLVDGIVDYKGPVSQIWDAINSPFWGVIISFCIMDAGMRVVGILSIYAYPKLRADMRTYIIHYVKDHSLGYFADNFAGAIATRIHEIPKSSHLLIENLIESVIAILCAFLFSTIILSTVNFIFAGLMFTWCAFHLGVTFYFLPELNRKFGDHADKISELNGHTVDFITNIIAVRLFANSRRELRRLNDAQEKEITFSKRAYWAYQKPNFLRGLAGDLFVVGMIYFLIHGYQKGWVTLGDFPLVAMTSFNILGLIWQLSTQFQALFRDYSTLHAALALLRTPHQVVDAENATRLVVQEGKIEFKDVTFSYRKRRPLFKDLSVTIHPGQKVGLVGFSGSGKTTFVNLILRFYDINSGLIALDGQDIAKVTQESLRSQIAMIPQEPNLFHRSLMENIRYGRPDATDEEVIEASKMAHCHEFIEEMEHGYQTNVGERGLKLSGGQRQRISIARAMLKNAKILILDEATSALDSITEQYIQQSLQEIMHNKTALVVAHRLSTLANVDTILVFDQGTIIEQGSLEELLKKEGHFYHLHRLQSEGFLPEKKREFPLISEV